MISGILNVNTLKFLSSLSCWTPGAPPPSRSFVHVSFTFKHLIALCHTCPNPAHWWWCDPAMSTLLPVRFHFFTVLLSLPFPDWPRFWNNNWLYSHVLYSPLLSLLHTNSFKFFRGLPNISLNLLSEKVGKLTSSWFSLRFLLHPPPPQKKKICRWSLPNHGPEREEKLQWSSPTSAPVLPRPFVRYWAAEKRWWHQKKFTYVFAVDRAHDRPQSGQALVHSCPPLLLQVRFRPTRLRAFWVFCRTCRSGFVSSYVHNDLAAFRILPQVFGGLGKATDRPGGKLLQTDVDVGGQSWFTRDMDRSIERSEVVTRGILETSETDRAMHGLSVEKTVYVRPGKPGTATKSTWTSLAWPGCKLLSSFHHSAVILTETFPSKSCLCSFHRSPWRKKFGRCRACLQTALPAVVEVSHYRWLGSEPLALEKTTQETPSLLLWVSPDEVTLRIFAFQCSLLVFVVD